MSVSGLLFILYQKIGLISSVFSLIQPYWCFSEEVNNLLINKLFQIPGLEDYWLIIVGVIKYERKFCQTSLISYIFLTINLNHS